MTVVADDAVTIPDAPRVDAKAGWSSFCRRAEHDTCDTLVDPNRPRGWGSHRLHRADGPAVVWPDGWGVHAWHGLRVPADLLAGWDHKRILSEPNTEIRRAAIEVAGWDRFVRDAGLSVVSEADDPGNPGQRLALYDVPEQIYDVPVRVLLCTNGSPERDGTRHQFGLTVPADISDAVSAAAWTYDLSAVEYAGMARRT